MELIVDGFIYYYQKIGGISRIYTEILPRLCDLEPELNATLLTYSKELSDGLPKHERINLRSMPEYRNIRPYRLRPYYSRLHKLATRAVLGRSKGKIWMSTYYTSPIIWAGPRVLVVYDLIHEKYRLEYWQNELSQVDKTIENKANAIAQADLIICISETTRQDLMRLYHVSEYKTAVAHLAHNPLFTLMDGIKEKQKEKYILYVGNRRRYKDFDILLRSYANWPNRFDIGLICVGGGAWTVQEMEELDRNELSNLVSLYPQADDLLLCRFYNQASAFIYPSQYEGFGIPLLEAMACGCPVVASSIPSSIEVARDVPIYFSPGCMEELIVALNQVISEGRPSSRTTAGQLLASQYSWESTACAFLQSFQSLV